VTGLEKTPIPLFWTHPHQFCFPKPPVHCQPSSSNLVKGNTQREMYLDPLATPESKTHPAMSLGSQSSLSYSRHIRARSSLPHDKRLLRATETVPGQPYPTTVTNQRQYLFPYARI
jgi:hypothetical protein